MAQGQLQCRMDPLRSDKMVMLLCALIYHLLIRHVVMQMLLHVIPITCVTDFRFSYIFP